MSTYSKHRPHPWHGLSVGPDAPNTVFAYIEMTSADPVKYEIDKETGYLIVDRPQKYSSQLPCLYGFVPRTYCGERVRALSPEATEGDGDPLDICVISSSPIVQSQILLNAKVIGGFRMIDGGEADDKIIAVLQGDLAWGTAEDIKDLPSPLIDKIAHYFLTYKLKPGSTSETSIEETYGKATAAKVIQASIEDYEELIGQMTER